MDGLGMIGVGRALGPQDGAGSRSRPEGKGLQLAAMYFVQVAALLLVSPRPLIICTSYIPTDEQRKSKFPIMQRCCVAHEESCICILISLTYVYLIAL